MEQEKVAVLEGGNEMEYNKAIISLLDGRTIEVKVKRYCVISDTRATIEAENGIEYCTSINNCVLIKE